MTEPEVDLYDLSEIEVKASADNLNPTITSLDAPMDDSRDNDRHRQTRSSRRDDSREDPTRSPRRRRSRSRSPQVSRQEHKSNSNSAVDVSQMNQAARVFVGNLSFTVKSTDLRDWMEKSLS